MQTLDELQQFIAAHPEDDTARLNYAQALPDDSPRRRFIILQLQIAHILSHEGNADDWDRHDKLRREAESLLSQHSAEWSAPVRERAAGLQSLAFARGFVESVTMSPRQFLTSAEALFAAAPILKLRLSSVEGLAELAQSPYLGRLRALSLEDLPLGEAGMRTLVASPHLKELRWLDVSGCKIQRGGLEALCASPNLPSLRWVNLAANGFPNPQDRPGSVDGDWIYDWHTDPLGPELEARYGHKEWLHFRAQHNTQWWPPAWQRFAGGRPEVAKSELFPSASRAARPSPARPAAKPAAKPAAQAPSKTSDKANDLGLPRYYAVNDRPLKFVATPEGGMDVLVMNLRTGEFERNMDYLWVMTARGSKPHADVDSLNEAEFNRLVKMHLDDLPPKR
jgi:uncharacterized protein (TIGR02996 family)